VTTGPDETVGTRPGDDPDARFIVVDGRRWRATDPWIPEALRTELVHELMAARRAVKQARSTEPATGSARRRVHEAKVALGERGAPWWEPASAEDRSARVAAAIRALLRHRRPDATVCPSEVARVVAGDQWRASLDQVRGIARFLAVQNELVVRQRGEVVDAEEAKGPIRYGRGSRFPDPSP
jgi:hypothetical protein